MKSAEDKHRLFVALWPPPPLAAEMLSLSTKAVGDGRPIPAAKLHVTVQFLGDVPASRLADIGAALDRVAGPPFELPLNRFGHWHRTRVVWLGSTPPCQPLLELASEVAAELRGAGFRRERRPFRGHLTVARNCRRPGDLQLAHSLRWTVRKCSLVESTLTPRGALYREIHVRSLGA